MLQACEITGGITRGEFHFDLIGFDSSNHARSTAAPQLCIHDIEQP